MDQLRDRKVEGRYFSGDGFPAWGEKGIMCYMNLLPEVEHRIILAESGVEMKTPFYMRNGEEGKNGRIYRNKVLKLWKRISG